MSNQLQDQLRQCLELVTKIRKEYPQGDFDQEMLHGDMDFRYRQIRQDRDKLDAFPIVVREFARFRDSLTAPEETIKASFQSLTEMPRLFAALGSIAFGERQRKLEQWAAELGTTVKYLNELLTRARLSGVLDSSYELNDRYREVVSAYLNVLQSTG